MTLYSLPSLNAILAISLLLSLVQATLPLPRLEYVPQKISKGPTTGRFVSERNAFDAPYISGLNGSAFECGDAFPLSGNSNNHATSVTLTGILPDGTIFFEVMPATGAILASSGPFGESASADFVGAGASFVGSPDLQQYRINVDALDTVGIKGNIAMTSTAPAHYPCSKNLDPGQTTEIFPHIGWSNALPAARVTGSLQVGNQTLTFKDDFGYHDHNWGDRPFTSLIKSWYWGHATLGPYTLVWFDGLVPSGTEQLTAYLAKDGEILLGSCAPGSVRVRPKGGDAKYPPIPRKGHRFNHLEVSMRLDNGKEFLAKVAPSSANIQAQPLYTRWIGTASGGFKGEKTYDGLTAFEEFTVF